jgi:hypothetical protein
VSFAILGLRCRRKSGKATGQRQEHSTGSQGSGPVAVATYVPASCHTTARLGRMTCVSLPGRMFQVFPSSHAVLGATTHTYYTTRRRSRSLPRQMTCATATTPTWARAFRRLTSGPYNPARRITNRTTTSASDCRPIRSVEARKSPPNINTDASPACELPASFDNWT